MTSPPRDPTRLSLAAALVPVTALVGLLFVRAFRSLDSIVGADETARQWLSSENLGLNGRPIDLIGQTEGLVRVVQYLDASRGLV